MSVRVTLPVGDAHTVHAESCFTLFLHSTLFLFFFTHKVKFYREICAQKLTSPVILLLSSTQSIWTLLSNALSRHVHFFSACELSHIAFLLSAERGARPTRTLLSAKLNDVRELCSRTRTPLTLHWIKSTNFRTSSAVVWAVYGNKKKGTKIWSPYRAASNSTFQKMFLIPIQPSKLSAVLLTRTDQLLRQKQHKANAGRAGWTSGFL